MSMHVSHELIRELVDSDGEELEVRTDYSGRGTSGLQCLGVVGGPRDLVRFALALYERLDEDERAEFAEEPVSQAQTGLSSVYYWPGVEVFEG